MKKLNGGCFVAHEVAAEDEDTGRSQ